MVNLSESSVEEMAHREDKKEKQVEVSTSSEKERAEETSKRRRTAEGSVTGDDNRAKNIDPEQYSQRAQFEEKTRKFNAAQEKNLAKWGNGKDILKRDKLELKWRENDLVRRRRELAVTGNEGNGEARWANEAMERLREGADLSEIVNEGYLMEQLERHKVSGVEREGRRQRYLGILRNELGLAQMIDKPTVMDRVTSLWMEKWYVRVNVAKGLDKVKALVPWGKKKRQEVIRARQDTVNTMLEAVEDNEVDSKVRALLQRMATEFEIMNVREVRRMLKYQRSKKKGKKKKTARQIAPAQGSEQNKAG
jgi:hypothetical protein